MRRNLLGLAAVFAVALILVGITFSGTAQDRADYVFVNGTEPKSLDPHKFTGQPEGRIGDALFEGLCFRDNDTLKPRPGSAESWDVSPDGKRWEFRIRETARWSNGDPVTAHDFVYSWKRLQEPETAAEYAGLMHMVRHAEAYNTYAAQVKTLLGNPKADEGPARTGIVGAYATLLAQHPSGIPATTFQTFSDEVGVRDAVIRTADRTLLAALGTFEGSLSPELSREVLTAFQEEAKRRQAALDEANAHFGVDQGVFAKDARTFVVELRAYTPYFLELTVFYPTYPVHRPTVERWPHEWFREGRIVSNGPFVIESWRVNEKIRLRKNPLYWDAGAVELATVDVIPIENQTTAFNLYRTGSADWLPTMYPADLIDVLKTKPDFYASPGLATYFYRINVTRKPFNDVRVRRALGMAIDRAEIVGKLTRKGEIPAVTLVPPYIEGYESPEGALRYDPVEARRLLAEAGFPGGKGFPDFSIIYNTQDMHKKIAERIARQWKENLGINAAANNKEWRAILEDVKRLNYDVERAGWVGDYADPNTFLDMWLTKGGNNQTGWSDPFYDRLIALSADPVAVAELPAADLDALLGRLKERGKAQGFLDALRGATEREARLSAASKLRFHLLREAEAILCQDALPILPIYFYVYTGIIGERVGGFHGMLDVDGKKLPNLQDLHPFRNVRMKKGERRAP
jgi:oligopeptide transport system substrate-binding protein